MRLRQNASVCFFSILALLQTVWYFRLTPLNEKEQKLVIIPSAVLRIVHDLEAVPS